MFLLTVLSVLILFLILFIFVFLRCFRGDVYSPPLCSMSILVSFLVMSVTSEGGCRTSRRWRRRASGVLTTLATEGPFLDDTFLICNSFFHHLLLGFYFLRNNCSFSSSVHYLSSWLCVFCLRGTLRSPFGLRIRNILPFSIHPFAALYIKLEGIYFHFCSFI